MDWMQQAENMFKSMMEAQQKMMDTMLETAKTMTEPRSAWEQVVQVWEKSIKKVLEQQDHWVQMWLSGLGGMEPPEEVKNAVKSMTQTWSTAQQMLWENWFAMIKQLDPRKLTHTSQADLTQTLDAWKMQMQMMIDAQKEWAQNLAGLGKNEE